MAFYSIAGRVRRIKPSPSTSAADRADELRRQGKPIVSLVVGEPDFDTPAHIRRAAAEAMENGATRYTSMRGSLALRAAIVAKLRRENGLSYGLDEIIVTSGAKSAIYSAFAATVESGDEVIIPAPYWVSYPDMVLACDGGPVTIACGENRDSSSHPTGWMPRSRRKPAGCFSIRRATPPGQATPRRSFVPSPMYWQDIRKS